MGVALLLLTYLFTIKCWTIKCNHQQLNDMKMDNGITANIVLQKLASLPPTELILAVIVSQLVNVNSASNTP